MKYHRMEKREIVFFFIFLTKKTVIYFLYVYLKSFSKLKITSITNTVQFRHFCRLLSRTGTYLTYVCKARQQSQLRIRSSQNVMYTEKSRKSNLALISGINYIFCIKDLFLKISVVLHQR